jgi:hypothetical protein
MRKSLTAALLGTAATVSTVTLVGCSSGTNGQPGASLVGAQNPLTAGSRAVATIPASSAGAAMTIVPSPTPTSTPSPSGTANPVHTTPGPAFTRFTLTCVVVGHEDLPGMPNTPMYAPLLTWHVAHATGMALSVDNPGLVGSYGTYGPDGSLPFVGGCYTDEGSHTITAYSIGGTGQRAVQTIHEEGTMTRPTPPPFSSPSN